MNTIVLSSFVCKRTYMYFYLWNENSDHAMKNAPLFACFCIFGTDPYWVVFFFPMFCLFLVKEILPITSNVIFQLLTILSVLGLVSSSPGWAVTSQTVKVQDQQCTHFYSAFFFSYNNVLFCPGWCVCMVCIVYIPLDRLYRIAFIFLYLIDILLLLLIWAEFG